MKRSIETSCVIKFLQYKCIRLRLWLFDQCKSLVLQSMQVHKIVVVHEIAIVQLVTMATHEPNMCLNPNFHLLMLCKFNPSQNFKKSSWVMQIGCMFQTLVHKFKSMLLKAYTRSKVPITYYVTINWDEAHGWGLF
jgi:hypothetical protein